jgi:hypothetical protein
MDERRNDEAARRGANGVMAVKTETDRLERLLRSNTELTQQDKELTEQVARLTREIHAELVQRG